MRWPSTAAPAGARGHAPARAESRDRRNACGAGKTALALRVARNTRRARIAVTLTRRPARQMCWACKRRTISHLAGHMAGGYGYRLTGRTARPGERPDSQMDQDRCSPASRVAGEDSFSPGGTALVGSARTRCGAFFVRRQIRRTPGASWTWSQRTRRAPGPGGGPDPWRSHQRRTPYQRSDPRTRSAARWP